MGIFIFLIGLMHLLAPKVAWFLEIGWKIQDSEPSEAYLIFTRIMGGIFIITSVIYMMQ